jgi:hypothetical protein
MGHSRTPGCSRCGQPGSKAQQRIPGHGQSALRGLWEWKHDLPGLAPGLYAAERAACASSSALDIFPKDPGLLSPWQLCRTSARGFGASGSTPCGARWNLCWEGSPVPRCGCPASQKPGGYDSLARGDWDARSEARAAGLNINGVSIPGGVASAAMRSGWGRSRSHEQPSERLAATGPPRPGDGRLCQPGRFSRPGPSPGEIPGLAGPG